MLKDFILEALALAAVGAFWLAAFNLNALLQPMPGWWG